jgi:hypothetical protein
MATVPVAAVGLPRAAYYFLQKYGRGAGMALKMLPAFKLIAIDISPIHTG